MINTIFEGDCLDKMRSINKGSVDLIYLDPPFFTERKHKLKNRERTQEFCFDDVWGSDGAYAEFLRARLVAMKDLLRVEGSIFIHCDRNGQYIIRALMDSIFGRSNFQSEIIWTYKRWSNSKKGLLPSHQNIYFYSKTKQFKFNTIYGAYSETTNIDQILQQRTRDQHNKSVYARDEAGEFKLGDRKKGVPLSDVWDIPYLNPKAKERVGYPTQKPLLLLERIVRLVTHEGDTVLDPFCGSGTTCVAAKLLRRQYIGIDKSPAAVDLARSRLRNPIKTESNLMKNGRESYATADQDALSLLAGVEFNPVQRNKGIDAILKEQFEGAPILVRVQKDNEPLDQAAALLAKAMKAKQSKKSILIQTQPSMEFVDTPFADTPFADAGMEIIYSPALQISSLVRKRK